jgi:hypothetical protein
MQSVKEKVNGIKECAHLERMRNNQISEVPRIFSVNRQWIHQTEVDRISFTSKQGLGHYDLFCGWNCSSSLPQVVLDKILPRMFDKQDQCGNNLESTLTHGAGEDFYMEWYCMPTSSLSSYMPTKMTFLSSPLRPWIISLHLFICSDDEASNGKMKKWEECGWKRLWSTYFRWFSIHSIHPRLIIWFLNNLVFTVWGCSLKPNPQRGGPGSGSYPLTCPAWEPLPVATPSPA